MSRTEEHTDFRGGIGGGFQHFMGVAEMPPVGGWGGLGGWGWRGGGVCWRAGGRRGGRGEVVGMVGRWLVAMPRHPDQPRHRRRSTDMEMVDEPALPRASCGYTITSATLEHKRRISVKDMTFQEHPPWQLRPTRSRGTGGPGRCWRGGLGEFLSLRGSRMVISAAHIRSAGPSDIRISKHTSKRTNQTEPSRQTTTNNPWGGFWGGGWGCGGGVGGLVVVWRVGAVWVPEGGCRVGAGRGRCVVHPRHDHEN